MTKHRISSLAALSLALGAASIAAAFPLAVEVENNTWRTAVEPETGTEVGPYSKVAAVIRDEGQFGRVLSNMEQLNHVFGFTDGAGLHLCLPEAAADAEADAAAAAAAAEADAAAAAAAAEADAAAAAAATEADAAAAAAAAEADAAAAAAAAAKTPDVPAADAPAAAPAAAGRTRSGK